MNKRVAYEDSAVWEHMYYTMLDRSHTNDYLAYAIDKRDGVMATHLAHLPRNRPFHLYGGLIMKLLCMALTATIIAFSISSLATGGASLGLSAYLMANYHHTIMIASALVLAISALGTLWQAKSVGSSLRSAYLVEEAKSEHLVAKQPDVLWLPTAVTPAKS